MSPVLSWCLDVSAIAATVALVTVVVWMVVDVAREIRR